MPACSSAFCACATQACSSLKAVGLKLVCKGTRSCKTTIRKRFGEKKHPIDLVPISGVSLFILRHVPKVLVERVSAIAAGPLPNGEGSFFGPAELDDWGWEEEYDDLEGSHSPAEPRFQMCFGYVLAPKQHAMVMWLSSLLHRHS